MKRLLFTGFFLVIISIDVDAQCVEGNCFDGNGSFLFENGDDYKGLWKKGYMHGNGTYYFQNGDEYKGSFRNGKMTGRGMYKYSDGSKYIGTWKDGKMHGRGHFYWATAGDLMDTYKYEGTFKEGVPVRIDIIEPGVPAERTDLKK